MVFHKSQLCHLISLPKTLKSVVNPFNQGLCPHCGISKQDFTRLLIRMYELYHTFEHIQRGTESQTVNGFSN